ncbi:sulfurase [Siminovitchia terrae]|uniref:MOSC domain-containing protein n=1 Tax=Siminovitchia terrae TaxID=1914933 RepID=A0A429X127_SIMTE|nr:MOSC domain-containing protein [Siminovitchia terrae]RST57171.1 MOSC domain-containing protein [Siminovitchia terrae]GIN96253.1 sulfurase [Siminovitchia terrae]
MYNCIKVTRRENRIIIKSLNIGRPQLIGNPFGQVINSGIRKKPASSAYLYKPGFENDDVADHESHGGMDRAVCFYPFEHYAEWNSLSGTELTVPAFGENITIEGYTEDDIYIGDIYQIGDAKVEITQSRIPCAKVDISNRIRGLFEQFIRTGKTGYFARVLEEGMVEEAAEITLIERRENTISVRDLHHLFFHDRKNFTEIERVIEIDELAADMRERLNKLIK